MYSVSVYLYSKGNVLFPLYQPVQIFGGIIEGRSVLISESFLPYLAERGK